MADQPLGDRLDRIINALVERGDATAALRDAELAPLARVAADLRHYPNRDFTARLRAQLERRTTMSTAIGNPAEAGLHHDNRAEPGIRLREGFTTVTPYIWVPDRGLADFLVRVFDAVETSVMDNPGHGIHREMRIGTSMVMIGETGDNKRGLSRPQAFHVFVDEVDATFARAIAAGGAPIGGPEVGDPQDRPYGERSGFVSDAYGNHWYIATPLGPQSVAHALGTVTPFLHAPELDAYMAFLGRAFDAVEEMRHEEPQGVLRYSRMRIGDAALEFGPAPTMPGAFFLYVGNPDAVYGQALAAGATSLAAPADRPSGRIAFVEDPVGNHWYIARPA
jgi:PhnB protein